MSLKFRPQTLVFLPLSSNVTVNVLSWMRMTTVPGFSRPIPSSVPLTQKTFPILLMRATLWPSIRSVDADSGYNALLSYHISDPKEQSVRIGTSSGEIRTKRRMSDNDLKTHPLVILVCDNGEPSLSATVSIDVVVVDKRR